MNAISLFAVRGHERLILPGAMVLGGAFALLFSFGAFYFYLLFLVLAGAERKPDRFLVLVACIGAVLVMGPLIALKLPFQDGGNDKLQYLDFMYKMQSLGIWQYMIRQPEIVSFSVLHGAASLVGVTDTAFLLIFVVFFSWLLVVIWREQYQAIPLFLVLLLSSSSFFGTYGNLMRQSMAFPLLFMAIFSASRRKAGLAIVLAGLTHIPSLIVGVPFLLYRWFGRIAIWCSLALTAITIVVSKLAPGLFAVSGNDDSYLSNKINLYSTWDTYSIAGVAAVAFAIFLLSNGLWRRREKWWRGSAESAHHGLRHCLVMMNFAALALVATSDLTKVFERIYIYFFVVALMYLSLCMVHVRRGPFKALILLVAVAYGVYGFAKNLSIQPLLYAGDPIAFLTASLFGMYSHFM
ncbi:EpsG family protein [Burkholderia pyrrocinia]|uniref:EpsG family protein n=1 Tax=Burkholderia pyrrocinia TaxID=60550 RepID=UPI0009E4F7A2|nr:EpsG family protein [Burkholderia pyrrocinia]